MRIDPRQFCLLLALFAAVGCEPEKDDAPRSAISIYVSIVPLEYFAGHIGGANARVRSLVGPGQSPATYEPTAKQLAELAESEVFFTVGVPIERQLVPRVRSAFPSVHVVDVRDGMPLADIEIERLAGDPGEPADHEHEADPHVWLSPRLAKSIAGKMSETLSRIDPAHAVEYHRNYQLLVQELDRLDAELTQLFAPLRGKELVVFHPAYGYFVNEYGLKQVAIEAGGVNPGSRYLVHLISRARSRGVKAIFVQPQFSSTAAEAVAEAIGADVVVLDPLARDYVENMWDIAIKIHSSFTNR